MSLFIIFYDESYITEGDIGVIKSKASSLLNGWARRKGAEQTV
jgi:hypothetical protein